MTPPPTPRRRDATWEDSGRSCPYCRFALKEGAPLIECGHCHAPHHADCWNDNGGCAVMGCAGRPGAAARPGVDPGAATSPYPTPPPPRMSPPPAPTYTQGYATEPYGTDSAYGAPPQHQRPSRGTNPVLVALVVVLGLAVAGGAGALVVSSQKDDGNKANVGNTISGRTTGTVTTTTDGPRPKPTTTTPTVNLLPDEDDSTMASEIQSLLLDFHRDVVDADYQSAWDLTSARYKSKKLAEPGGYEEWASNQSTLTPYLVPDGLQVSIVDKDPSSGVAAVNVTGMEWTDPKSPCTRWEGVTWAKYENGAWRYEPGYSVTPQRRAKWYPRRTELLGWGCV
jgi:Prokaryotic RING finger family 1